MARLKVLPCALYDSSTGFSAAALTGCFGLPSSNGTVFFISAHTAFDTVMAAPLYDSVNGVTISLFVSTPVAAPSGIGASMCAPSSSPLRTRSNSTFQLACASSVT
jgi:hypothetical protein